MNNIVTQFSDTALALQQNLSFVILVIACLYGIHIVNWMSGFRLNYLGIYPRKFFGLFGIIFSPFLHGNFNHLFFNSIPLCILLSFVLLKGIPVFIYVTFVIFLIGGLGTWLFGRKGLHIGASGLIMGYWSYLLVDAYYHTTLVSVALAGVCLYYFGGLLFNLFPQAVRTSWEAHVFGFCGGIAAAYLTM
ncbi:MAG: rhomboid family intramembrane serine protease [Gammaproteobacteria bacterium]|nr:rhomboid family intramembrane serine protease [Gammaproteobacteria bacterium]